MTEKSEQEKLTDVVEEAAPAAELSIAGRTGAALQAIGDAEKRDRALRYAVELHMEDTGSPSAKTVVATATAFHAFLCGNSAD